METKEVKQTKIQFLKSRAYMGHIVNNEKGKRLSWRKLSSMNENKVVTVEVIPGFNFTYNIQK